MGFFAGSVKTSKKIAAIWSQASSDARWFPFKEHEWIFGVGIRALNVMVASVLRVTVVNMLKVRWSRR